MVEVPSALNEVFSSKPLKFFFFNSFYFLFLHFIYFLLVPMIFVTSMASCVPAGTVCKTCCILFAKISIRLDKSVFSIVADELVEFFMYVISSCNTFSFKLFISNLLLIIETEFLIIFYTLLSNLQLHHYPVLNTMR